MTKARLDGILLLIVGSVVFVLMGAVWERSSPVSMLDFKELYYGARCLLHHADPYQESELLRVYQADLGDQPPTPDSLRQVVTLYINLPTAFILTTPFALLPWGPAHVLWMVLTAATYILAAFLMWSLCAEKAPTISGGLLCLFLLGSELLLEIGNAAGLAVSLCIIAVWCLLKDRFVPAGFLCFALSLATKPHVAGMVWLYFLLADTRLRKHALQTLAVTGAISLPVILWVSHIAPHWNAELHADLQTFSVHGGLGDPGPASFDPRLHGAVMISLQTVFSLFRDDPRFYNAATYLLCAPLLVVWAIVTVRKRFSMEAVWFALASLAALSMLPLYHRLHDAKLLLLVLPAFAVLWARRGPVSWLALLITSAGIVLTDDIPVQLLAIHSAHLRATTSGIAGLVLTLVLARPVPLVLLALGVFYLYAYVRHVPRDDDSKASYSLASPART